MDDDHTSSVTLDAAIDAMRDIPAPDGPPPELVQRTLHRLRGPAPVPMRNNWRMSPNWKILAVAASVLFCAAVIAILLTWGPGANTSYAQIQHEIETAQSVTFTAITEEKGVRHVSRVMLKQPGLMRVESADGIVTTTNFESGKILAIYPTAKKALAIDLNNRPGFMTPRNFLDELKKVIATNAAPLGRKKENGQTLQGFRFTRDGNSQDIWIDPATKSPVRIDVRGPNNTVVMSWTDVAFNKPLADALFTTTAPSDYALSQSEAAVTVIGKWPTEKNLLTGLELAARHNNNIFPGKLDDVSARLIKQSKATGPPTPQIIEVMQNIGLAAAFESMMPPDSGYEYAGQGVQLGDSQTPICWWRPQDKRTWTVIYGDLSMADEAVRPKARPATNPQPQ